MWVLAAVSSRCCFVKSIPFFGGGCSSKNHLFGETHLSHRHEILVVCQVCDVECQHLFCSSLLFCRWRCQFLVSIVSGSMKQMDEFTRGRIVGLAEAGVKPSAIAKKVRQTDGMPPKADAVRKTIRKHKVNGKWRGERQAGSGRPSILSDATRKRIIDLVFANRGSAVVTIRCGDAAATIATGAIRQLRCSVCCPQRVVNPSRPYMLHSSHESGICRSDGHDTFTEQ